jgi:hypothetical protein
MRASEILIEGLSRVVYHYTSPHAAKKILNSGEFELSSTLGSIEQQYAPNGYPYFLSTTRTRRGGYHDSGFTMNKGVLFVLNGEWYNSRYPAGPVDYWGNRDPEQSHHRKHEAEDRIYSKNPTIQTTGVTSVHVFVTLDADDNTRAQARGALISAKRAGIPAYYYDDQESWLNLNTKKTGNIAQLTGQDLARGSTSRHSGYLMPWLELINAKTQNQLSKKADSIRYNLNYTYDKQNAEQGLSTDLSNARKPNAGPDRENAIKIIDYMKRNRLKTVSDLVNQLEKKWKNS